MLAAWLTALWSYNQLPFLKKLIGPQDRTSWAEEFYLDDCSVFFSLRVFLTYVEDTCMQVSCLLRALCLAMQCFSTF